METPSTDFEYVLVAICGILMAFLVAMAFWTEGILRSFSKRRSMERKKEALLDTIAKLEWSDDSTGTVNSNGSLDSPSTSPERGNKKPTTALYMW